MSEFKSGKTNMQDDASGNKMSNQSTSNNSEAYSVNQKLASVRETINEMLKKKFEYMSYDYEVVQAASKEFSETVKMLLKERRLGRYKFIVQTVIAEQKNQGLNLASKSFWDDEVDFSFSEQFLNDNVMVVVSIWGIYVY